MNALTKTAPRWRDKLLLNEDLNFLLTNRVPRRLLTQFMGRFSKIRSPWLTRLSIWVWRQFTELDLSDAKRQRFDSLHECFTRELQPGARTVVQDEELLASPVDCIVGAVGRVEAGSVLQAKGMPYRVSELLGSEADARLVEGGSFITLRLTSAMYHRFHAPCDAQIEHVRYLSGDTWNVNPIALARVERLFCRNERAPIRMRLRDGQPLFVVPVAAILVASIRFHFLGDEPYPRLRGATELPCDASVQRGQELGWFEHGSTLVIFVPPGFEPLVANGQRLRMGEALMHRVIAAS
jgi:phosphatidylserine decarboxylase